MEIVQVRINQQVGDLGGYYNYEFAIVKRKERNTVFDLAPMQKREKDFRLNYEIRNNEYKTILKE